MGLPARSAHAEATHESSKAESKHDTRGLEAAYLAGGQARQAKEILDSIKLYEVLTAREFAADEPIDLTALLELDAGGARSLCFIGPRNGGLEIERQRKEITVITPQSPMGQNLMGKKAVQRWTDKSLASPATPMIPKALAGSDLGHPRESMLAKTDVPPGPLLTKTEPRLPGPTIGLVSEP